MGEVYKARDTRLDRIVAIKVLPPELALDPQFRERFDREARAISALDHPNICALYDVGDEGGTSFLVMQFLDGEPLTDRLARGALPLDDALRIAIEIAGALDRAHRAGIVHRDLKPGNIVLTKSGAKLLDFGLAKTTALADATARSPVADVTRTPTISAPLTQQGMLLGTFQYMAPEQIEGDEADARTDVFAFGAVFYEMLTGRKAFEGKTQASIIGAIMAANPAPVSALQPLAPASLDRVVKKCLAKDSDARWQSAADLRDELQWIASAQTHNGTSPGEVPGAPRERLWRAVAAACAAGAAAAATVAGVTLYRARQVAPGPLVARFDIVPPANVGFTTGGAQSAMSVTGIVSPDGTRVMFTAGEPGSGPKVWVRAIDSFEAHPVDGTDGAMFPFWSPDGNSIAFFIQDTNRLRRVHATGGAPQTICELPPAARPPRGGTWSRDGVVLFGTGGGGIYRVSADGGQANPVTSRDSERREISHRWPSFLPDARHFLYWVNTPSDATSGVWVASTDGGEPRRIVGSDTNAVFESAGFLIFSRDGALVRQRFDPSTLAVSGGTTTVAEQVASDLVYGFGAFSVSDNGVLAYRAATIAGNQFAWVDRSGRVVETVGPPGNYQGPAMSPDGTRLAFRRTVQTSSDIWILDLRRGGMARFTMNPGVEHDAVWSPDGAWIYYTSDQTGTAAIFRKAADSSRPEELIYSNPVAPVSGLVANDVSPDGKYLLLFQSLGTSTGYDVFVLPIDGDRRPVPVVQTPTTDSETHFSPDGRWIAYYSMDSGRREVFVQPFPSTGARWQVSNAGGRQPLWRADGRELFYVTDDHKFMAVDINPKDGTLDYGTPHLLFTMRANVNSTRNSYVPSRDGQRFLVNMLRDSVDTPISVVVNWTAELNK
jgi:eukaryotic-like serine/threonine-protein kinase